jgi:hypothetical protein
LKELRFKKDSGCILQVVEFNDGQVVAVWVTGAVHEVAIYKNLKEFLSVRTPERGYTKIYESDYGWFI